jgi:hypothetical protein
MITDSVSDWEHEAGKGIERPTSGIGGQPPGAEDRTANDPRPRAVSERSEQASDQLGSHQRRHREEELVGVWAPRWWAVFATGLALWVGAVVATYLTSDVFLLPTAVLLGSFVVPVTAVLWYLDHDPSAPLSPRRVVGAFIIAGAVGVLDSSLLEYYPVGSGLLGNLEVDLIEEVVKAVLIVLLAIGIRSFHTRDGMVLGATVGSLFVGQGRRGHLRFAWSILAAYLAMAVLHAAFDSTASIAGYVVVSLVGLAPLVWLWWRADGRAGAPVTA